MRQVAGTLSPKAGEYHPAIGAREPRRARQLKAAGRLSRPCQDRPAADQRRLATWPSRSAVTCGPR